MRPSCCLANPFGYRDSVTIRSSRGVQVSKKIRCHMENCFVGTTVFMQSRVSLSSRLPMMWQRMGKRREVLMKRLSLSPGDCPVIECSLRWCLHRALIDSGKPLTVMLQDCSVEPASPERRMEYHIADRKDHSSPNQQLVLQCCRIRSIFHKHVAKILSNLCTNLGG